MRLPMLGLGLAVVLGGAAAADLKTSDPEDPFLVQRYDQRHASAAQERFRRLAPMPVGVVYIQHPGEGEPEMREHFRTMKRLGFTALKGILPVPGWTREKIALVALEEGIIPWWYGEGGWDDITPVLKSRLGLAPNAPMAQVREDPRMIAHQTEFLRQRILRVQAMQGRVPVESVGAFVAEVGGAGPELAESARLPFFRWVRERYGTIERLNQAYNQQHAGLQPEGGVPFASWADYEERWSSQNPREYRHLCDQFRFKADARLEFTRQRLAEWRALDPAAPFRAGGELGLFLPAAWYGVDLERLADLMTDAGAFYPSIHLAWHFQQVDQEITRPVYLQAALAADLFKGGWVASWESSGGPQVFDGGKGGEGFTVDENTITQLMLSYLAGGFKGFGFWCWSARSAGREAGEYSLLDRNNQMTPRAIRAGAIGQAARRHRDELWQAHKEPVVGIYVDWDQEAVWAAMSVSGREVFRQRPVEARVGVSRALINANVPFEYVTATDLRAGLAGRYRVIYLPAVIALPRDLLERLGTYAEEGGRLVMDLPSGWYDEDTALLPTDRGSVFERVVGVVINEYQYAGTNRPERLSGLDLEGCVVHLTPTHAQVLARYDSGNPAVTEAHPGRGTVVLLGYEAARSCFRPGQAAAETLLTQWALGPTPLPFACPGAIAYRLASPAADHYFLINDGPARRVTFPTGALRYTGWTDAVTGENLSRGRLLDLEAYSGRWIRAEKAALSP